MVVVVVVVVVLVLSKGTTPTTIIPEFTPDPQPITESNVTARPTSLPVTQPNTTQVDKPRIITPAAVGLKILPTAGDGLCFFRALVGERDQKNKEESLRLLGKLKNTYLQKNQPLNRDQWESLNSLVLLEDRVKTGRPIPAYLWPKPDPDMLRRIAIILKKPIYVIIDNAASVQKHTADGLSLLRDLQEKDLKDGIFIHNDTDAHRPHIPGSHFSRLGAK